MSNRTDNFNRTNSTSSMNPPSDGGSNWVALSGTWGVNANKGYESSGSGVSVVYLESASVDTDVQATVSGHGSGADNYSVAGRIADVDNLLFFRENAGAYDLFKKVAASYTAIFTGVGTAADGDILKLSMSGSTIKCYLNGTQVGGTQTITDGQTNTKHGFWDFAGTNSRYDDFSITDAGGSAINGTASVTLGALTSSATGTLAVQGTTSVTLGALTSTATGVVAITGTASRTLGACTSAATGAVAIQGTTTQTLGACTLTAAGSASITGTASNTLGAVTCAATGIVAIAGTASVTLGAATLAATGTGLSAILGQMAATLLPATLTATGEFTVIPPVVATVRPVTIYGQSTNREIVYGRSSNRETIYGRGS